MAIPTTRLTAGEPDRMPPSRRRVVTAVAVVVAVVGLYLLAAWVLSHRVPRGTTVAGLDIGGLGADAARQRLIAARAEVRGGLPVRASGTDVRLDPAEVGLAVDPAATVGRVTGFTVNPVALRRHLGGGGRLEAGPAPSPLVDELTAVREATDRAPRDARVTFVAGAPKLTAAVTGSALEVPAAAELVRHQWLSGRRIDLPTAAKTPAVTQETGERALSDIARPAVAEPLRLTVDGTTVTVPAKRFAPALRITPKDGGLRLTVDGATLRHALLEDHPGLGVEPKDAQIVLRGGKPAVVPGVAGTTVDADSLADAVPKALAPGGSRRVTVATTLQQPDLTTAEARGLGVEERVSTFSTNLTANPQRTGNLRIAARTVDGTLVLPGGTFSLNEVLGQRTAAKGYDVAPTIQGGRLVPDYGGGVSQMATTIFNNVFFAGLQDITHKAHSFWIPRYPEGREATVNFPTVDLKWRNDSRHGVLVQASVDASQVHVSFWSTKVWDVTAGTGPRTNVRPPKVIHDDSPTCVDQDPSDGFDVAVTRTFRRPGSSTVVRTQTFRTHYIPEDDVVCESS